MKDNLILVLLLFFALSCKTKEKEKVERKTNESESVVKKEIIEKQTDSTKLNLSKTQQTEKKYIPDWKHPEYFRFENYKEYKITDTINIDLNGNGILEQVYFDNKGCQKLLIKENGQKTISIGCGKEEYDGFPNAVGWIDLWCVVYDKETFEIIIKDGEILGDKNINLERPSLFVGKEEAGGGIITYRNDKLYWIHQSD